MDKLSTLFQDFYAVAASHINTHISTLSSRQHRESSPAPSVSSLSSTASKLRKKAASISKQDRPKLPPERRESEQQMLTPEEIAERKRFRKGLEIKRVALEEAVERRVCEGIYDRIWRHRSTQDEAQDEKLRSKTAALSVVGIGLTDLGIDLGQGSSENPEATGDKEKEVREWLEEARIELVAMNDEKYPLAKLLHLKAAHKSIVDTLSHFHPSSSADEIMPMLIYTLITSRPEGIDVISNLFFIQRFRNESKIDGEAAYCLTNLEAAITFLETVDLASLREDEAPSGPPKPSTPRSRPESLRIGPSSGLSTPEINSVSASPSMLRMPNSPSGLRPGISPNNRRLSDMFQPPAKVLGAASDAMISTADEGFKNISNSLGESYKFLLGKLKEREGDPRSPEMLVPKTLDDARKIVSTPPPDDDGSVSGASSLHSPDSNDKKHADPSPMKPEDRVLSLIGGKMTRDRSADSVRSGSSSTKKLEVDKTPSPAPRSGGEPAIVESMRNLGNSLNPMNKFASMAFPTFGGGTARRVTVTAPAKAVADGGVTELTTVCLCSSSLHSVPIFPATLNGLFSNEQQAFPDIAPLLPPKETAKIAPPNKRFMELQNPGELKINEVLELLRDYRRLAGALKEVGAFKE